MLELLWFLLPVAAASGWYAARRHPVAAERPKSALPANYYQGVNFLLNEQPDKAIEVFTGMFEVNSETVEIHMVLGNLFRRRGEVDRAIRIHQNLIARTTLTSVQRSQAMLELGQDYVHVGLFDRAESLFQEIVELQTHSEAALRHLLAIYQQEKEWQNAIGVALQLQKECTVNTAPVVAHFYCELAELQLTRNDLDAAQALFNRAATSDAHCVRAILGLGNLMRQARQYEAAIRLYQSVEQQDESYLPEVMDPLRVCFLALNQQAHLEDYLRALSSRYSGIAPLLLLTDLLRNTQGATAAGRFLADYLERYPSVRGLEYWLGLQRTAADGTGQAALYQAQAVLTRLLAQQSRYRCKHCGYTSNTLHWQCPGCKEWGSIRPLPDLLCEAR